MATIQKYLHKRPGSDNWQIRLAVPNSLKAQLGKSEITKSTGTSDRKTAETFAMGFISEQREMFATLLADAGSIVRADIHGKIVDIYHKQFLRRLREEKRAAENYDDWCDMFERSRKKYIRYANTKDYALLRPWAKDIITDYCFAISTQGEEFEKLLPKLMDAILDAFEIVRQEIDGKFDAEPQSRFVQETIAADQDKPKPGERLEDYLEKYEAEEINDRQRKPANVEQAKNAIELFIEWVGANKNVANLNRRDASSFREVLSKFPARRGSIKQLKAETILRCVEIAERDDLALLSIRTKNRYISDLSGFFRWMKKRGYCEENIWIGMSFDMSNVESSYPPFSTDQLNQIMKSPLYSGFLRDGKEHVSGNMFANDWRFWLPLLCMFTGARITEIAQMFVDDIYESENHLAGYIRTNSERGQSTKTKLSARLVVFHPVLLHAGFREYWQLQVKRAAQDGNEQLFPELTTYEKRPELGRKPARWWRAYLTKIGIKSGADGIGSHSFRHRLADEMRTAGYLDAEFGLLVMGHSERSMTARYGKVPQGTVQRLADMIAKAEFKGVDFSNILPKPCE